jgi:hypothetical protein
MLSEAPLVNLTANAELCTFLCCDVREQKIGLSNYIPDSMNVFHFDDDLIGRCQPECEYADAVTRAALSDQMSGTHVGRRSIQTSAALGGR